MNKLPGFTLSYHRDEPPNRNYPTGYWVAKTSNGDYDGVGGTPRDAMADLINTLYCAHYTKSQGSTDLEHLFPVNFCQKCDKHARDHKDSLTEAFHRARSDNVTATDVAMEYFQRYHGRGHRKDA